jgi:beta-glucosidase-like glycosyl hydrolase
MISRNLLARFARKVFGDLLPAALVSVLGTVMLAQFGMGRAPVQAPPPAAGAAGPDMVQMLRDEHALIVEFMKRDAEAKQQSDAAVEAVAKVKLALAEKAAERANHVAAVTPAPLRVAKLADKPAAEKKLVAAKEPLQLMPVAMVEPAPMPAVAQPVAEPAKREHGVIATVRGLARDVVAAPGRVWSAVDDFFSDVTTPKLPPLPVPNRQFEARM